jgi:hypothetical protein
MENRLDKEFMMRKLFSTLCATALAASFGIAGALPTAAAPIYVPQTQPLQASDVVSVDYHWRKKRRGDRRHNRHSGFYKRGNHGYYNGHRGYRHRRHGYRYYNGWWFPGGAFVAGAIIGGALANSNTYYRGGGSAHVEWCYDRYRSYRAYDNTFQPYNGPRRQCYSPYS